MPVGIWTQAVRLSWRPSLHYYEQRIPFLKELDEAGLVRAFRVSDLDRVEALIVGPGHELTLTPTSVEIDVIAESAEWRQCDEILARATELSQPNEIAADVTFQLMAPLDIPFRRAVQAAKSSWFGSWVEQQAVTDHALLLDFDDPDGQLEYQVEFGVVAEDEIRPRIRRTAGRTRSPRRDLPPDWRREGLPEVAVFMEFRADLVDSVPVPDDLVPWLSEIRKRSVARAVDMCQQLEDLLREADTERESIPK